MQESLDLMGNENLLIRRTGYPDIRPARFPGIETGYPAGYENRPVIQYNPT